MDPTTKQDLAVSIISQFPTEPFSKLWKAVVKHTEMPPMEAGMINLMFSLLPKVFEEALVEEATLDELKEINDGMDEVVEEVEQVWGSLSLMMRIGMNVSSRLGSMMEGEKEEAAAPTTDPLKQLLELIQQAGIKPADPQEPQSPDDN